MSRRIRSSLRWPYAQVWPRRAGCYGCCCFSCCSSCSRAGWIADGGTMELVASEAVWPHFQIMSSELNTPKILFCPTDPNPMRTQANMFGASAGNTNTSYFVGVDAVGSNPQMFLAGDRNLTVKNVA